MNDVLTLCNKANDALLKADDYGHKGETDLHRFWLNAADGFLNRAKVIVDEAFKNECQN